MWQKRAINLDDPFIETRRRVIFKIHACTPALATNTQVRFDVVYTGQLKNSPAIHRWAGFDLASEIRETDGWPERVLFDLTSLSGQSSVSRTG